jgi:hypothetical protein
MEKIFPPNKTTPLKEQVREEQENENCEARVPADGPNAPEADEIGKSRWGGMNAKRNKGGHNDRRHRP